jgi:hypothetical protein
MSQQAVKVRAVEPSDLVYLAEHLREQDVAELRAAGHTDIHAALVRSVAMSNETFVAVANGKPVAVFGCAEHGSLLAKDGVPWLLGTQEIVKHRRVLQRWARGYITDLLGRYPRLFNAVHAENTVSVRWLKALGFDLHPPVAVPPHGAMFQMFEVSRHV